MDDCVFRVVGQTRQLKIDVSYSFSSGIIYDFTNMECFVHELFLSWLQSYNITAIFQFDSCDISVTVKGGRSITNCATQPCITINSTISPNRRMRRLMQEHNPVGNSSMIITTNTTNIYNILNDSITSMETQSFFETEYYMNFGVNLSVSIQFELDSEENQNNEVETSSAIKYMFYTIAGVAILIICVGAILLAWMYRTDKLQKKYAYKFKIALAAFHDTQKFSDSNQTLATGSHTASNPFVKYHEEHYNQYQVIPQEEDVHLVSIL